MKQYEMVVAQLQADAEEQRLSAERELAALQQNMQRAAEKVRCCAV